MNAKLKIALAAASVAFATLASAEITFYDREGFDGRGFTASGEVRNFERAGFNDRASSVVVIGERWEVCEDFRFQGRCAVLRPGRYPSLAAMGLNDRISSARSLPMRARFDDDRYAPEPLPVYDDRRRRGERLFQVNVTSVRAVVGPPSQRCWMEKEQVVQQQGAPANVGGAVLGGLLGGVIGHQVNGGSRDIATVGGAVAGAAIGSQVGRNGGGQVVSTQDVQKCETVQSTAKPEFWDVTYMFEGREHRVQMTAPPGPTIQVNREGEPRS